MNTPEPVTLTLHPHGDLPALSPLRLHLWHTLRAHEALRPGQPFTFSSLGTLAMHAQMQLADAEQGLAELCALGLVAVQREGGGQ